MSEGDRDQNSERLRQLEIRRHDFRKGRIVEFILYVEVRAQKMEEEMVVYPCKGLRLSVKRYDV